MPVEGHELYIGPEAVAVLSRAVTFEPIASCSSTSLLMLRRTTDSSKVRSKCRHKIELRKFR